jgi:hypothetical protein
MAVSRTGGGVVTGGTITGCLLVVDDAPAMTESRRSTGGGVFFATAAAASAESTRAIESFLSAGTSIVPASEIVAVRVSIGCWAISRGRFVSHNTPAPPMSSTAGAATHLP